jgi:hypothetical protein
MQKRIHPRNNGKLKIFEGLSFQNYREYAQFTRTWNLEINNTQPLSISRHVGPHASTPNSGTQIFLFAK